MHNNPHTEEAKAKMRAAKTGKPTKWGHLPHDDIVRRLLTTEATTRNIAEEYGCDPSTIKLIFRKYTTEEQRLQVKCRKQAEKLKGYKHSPEFGQAHSERMRGEKNPFHGKKHTAAFKQEQSKRKKGKSPSEAARIAISAAQQGIPVDVWQGFKHPENARARRGSQFKEWRKAVYERDDYKCQLCKKRGGRLHPHHIKTFAKYPELRFEVSNGVTLCAEPCHEQMKGREEEFEHLFLKE